MKNNLIVTDIQRFCMHDGPGVRTTVFLKGCPLHCAWCHNPETIAKGAQIMFTSSKCIGCLDCVKVCENGCHTGTDVHLFDNTKCIACGKCAEVCPSLALNLAGKSMSVEDIICEVKKDVMFYGENGGLTVSGGEPTFQFEGLIELLKATKVEGVTTCIETCGMFPKDKARLLCEYTDTFLFDIKDTDAYRLKENTGADLKAIIETLHEIDIYGKPIVLRCIMIPKVNMTSEHMYALSELYKSLKNVKYVEFMPYHPYGISKATQIGKIQKEYTKPIKEDLLTLAEVLKANNVPVKLDGAII